jgi:hypothetical protein
MTTDLLDAVFQTIDPTYKRVGYLEYVDDTGRPHYEYLCTIGCETCVHHCCRMAALRTAGFHQIAARLEANATARDWAGNWGKMIYEKGKHGHDPQRRKMMADMIRAMRKETLSYGAACIGGCWVGALIDT